MWDTIVNYFADSGFGQLAWGNLVMLAIGLLFIFLAIRKGFEPLLLVPIGFGILIGNIPYNTSQLSLGVYDGPVPVDALDYFAIDPDAATIEMHGRTFRGMQSAWEHLQDYRGEHRVGYEHSPFRPWTHRKLMEVIEASDRVTFPHTELLPVRSRGEDRLAVGEALLINEHTTYSADAVPPEGEGAVVESIGQGRYVFIHRGAADELPNRFPQVWSEAKQAPGNASVFWWLFAGVGIAGFYPPLIFLGVGALTDFGPLLANPRTILLGAAAQFGIFGALLGAVFLGFDIKEAAAIGIIGGADGPTAIFTATKLAPHLLGAVALAAYSYMAMVPIIQPPIMRLLTTEKERKIRMDPPRNVPKKLKIIFPITGFILTAFITPGALPLLGMLFFGNLLRESLVTDRLAKTSQTAFIDIVTILLGVTVGAKTQASNFLTVQTIGIFALGIAAFVVATATGVLFGKLMNVMSKKPINPLIGAAGVSAVPMAARVVHTFAQKEDPQNYLIMHAMGPNVAGVIGSAVAAGVLLSSLS
jgi:oxaloacetate decarboxylase beta subunit